MIWPSQFPKLLLLLLSGNLDYGFNLEMHSHKSVMDQGSLHVSVRIDSWFHEFFMSSILGVDNVLKDLR